MRETYDDHSLSALCARPLSASASTSSTITAASWGASTSSRSTSTSVAEATCPSSVNCLSSRQVSAHMRTSPTTSPSITTASSTSEAPSPSVPATAASSRCEGHVLRLCDVFILSQFPHALCCKVFGGRSLKFEKSSKSSWETLPRPKCQVFAKPNNFSPHCELPRSTDSSATTTRPSPCKRQDGM